MGEQFFVGSNTLFLLACQCLACKVKFQETLGTTRHSGRSTKACYQVCIVQGMVSKAVSCREYLHCPLAISCDQRWKC